jgi:ribonuclease P protein component
MDLADPSVQAFPKTLRLLTRADFTRVNRRGRRVHTGGFVVLTDRGRHEWTRLGITVGRQAGKAVRRNRAKRLVREYFRTHRLRFAPGYDLVVIVRNAESLVNLREVEKNFEHFFRKAAHMDRSRNPGKGGDGTSAAL